jgi:flagellar assembly factor FliW
LKIRSHRFGELEVGVDDEIVFPEGLVGLSARKRFVMLRDPDSEDLIWLQSVDEPALALATIHHSKLGWPYRIEMHPQDTETIKLGDPSDAEVFVILNRVAGAISANLRGPLVINAERMMGKQVIQHNPAYQVRQPLAGIDPAGELAGRPHAAAAKEASAP